MEALQSEMQTSIFKIQNLFKGLKVFLFESSVYNDSCPSSQNYFFAKDLYCFFLITWYNNSLVTHFLKKITFQYQTLPMGLFWAKVCKSALQ